MISALRRRSLRELTKRGARSWLTMTTIAVAVVGVWLLAIPALIDDAMTSRLDDDRLNHVRLFPNAVVLSDAEIDGLAELPNVTAADAKIVAGGQVNLSGRLIDVGLVGVRDFSAQRVDVVAVESGAAPEPGEVLADGENLRFGRLAADIGDTLSITGPAGTREFAVSGTGGTILFASGVREGDPILYMTADTLRDLTGWPGVTSIELHLDQRDAAVVSETITAAQVYLDDINPGQSYWLAPGTWDPGEWPDKDDFDNFRSLFTILAGVAVLSGLFMVYNTMNTLVRQETHEIGMMKALGGRRRHIAGAFLETAGLMGLIATIAGSVAGVLLANLLVSAIATSLMSAQPHFGVPLEVLGIAAVIGIAGTMLAALPGVLRATRISVRDAMEHHGIEARYGDAWLDRALQRFRFLSRSAQLGLRSAARSKGRSVATGLQIGLAAGTAIAFIALGATMVFLNNQTFDVEAGDIHLFEQGGRGLDDTTAGIVEAVDGVAAAHPIHYATYGFRGENYGVWSLPTDTVFDYDLGAGRWFREGESDVVVVGQALANVEDLAVDDVITVERFDGPIEVTVIGIDNLMVNGGKGIFTPLTAVLAAAGRSGSNAYWIETVSSEEAAVDAAAGGIEQALRSRGHSVSTELRYVERAANQSEASLILTFIVLLGVPVLAIGMIALVSTMTTNVLERTKEIGVLRSIGARRRHLGKMLRTEGMAVAFVGWLLGVPLGYGIARLLIWLISRAFGASFPVIFPLWSLVPVLVLTLAVAALVVRIPLRRVARMRPGDALRYE